MIKFKLSVKQLIRRFLLDLRNNLSKFNPKPRDKFKVNQDVINLTALFNFVLDNHGQMRPMSRKKQKRLTDKPWITSVKTHFY